MSSSSGSSLALLLAVTLASGCAAARQPKTVVPGSSLGPLSLDVTVAELEQRRATRVDERSFRVGRVAVHFDDQGRAVRLETTLRPGQRLRIGDVRVAGGMPLAEAARKVPGCEVALLDQVLLGGRVIPCHGVSLVDDGHDRLGAVKVYRGCAESPASQLMAGELTPLEEAEAAEGYTLRLNLTFCGLSPLLPREGGQVQLQVGGQSGPALLLGGSREWLVRGVLKHRPGAGRLCIRLPDGRCAFERALSAGEIEGWTR